MKRWKVALCVILLSLSMNSEAGIGTITEQINTPASIQRSKTTVSGTKGTGVEMQDAINTTKGKVGITFEDQTKVEVNENSKLVIDDFVYDPKSSKGGKLAMKFASGTVKYTSGAIAHNDPSKVAINTPSATIGVRGTDFTATVDDAGASTVILLPSCPINKIIRDVETECVTGKIEVYNDAGSVVLDKPFQGTKVESRGVAPMKPAILHLTMDTINNLLIVSPPSELTKERKVDSVTRIAQVGDMLAVNILQQNFLQNEFEKEGPVWDNPLSKPLLQQYFLEDIFNILSQQLQQESAALLGNMLSPENSLLPDWFKASQVTKEITPTTVGLCRTDGSSNTICLTVPKDQNTTTYMMQADGVNIKNRVNAGNNTIITLKQN
jgi:FecR protein